MEDKEAEENNKTTRKRKTPVGQDCRGNQKRDGKKMKAKKSYSSDEYNSPVAWNSASSGDEEEMQKVKRKPGPKCKTGRGRAKAK